MPFWAALTVLLAACSAPSDEVDLAIPSVAPSPAPVETTPTPTLSPAETDPPAWTGLAVDFTGDWERTNIYIAFPGHLEIKNQTQSGFDFSGWALWYSHGGDIHGTAYFVDENTAFWRYTEEEWCLDEPSPTGTVRFSLSDSGILTLEQSGFLPFGMNAGIAGEYTLNEPEYFTNGVMEALGPERIALLKEAVGEDYESMVGFPLSIGLFELSEVNEGDCSGLFLEGWVPTMGYQQKIFIGDNGAIWVQFAPHINSGKCYTNRPGEDLPDFLLYPEQEEGSE